MFSSLSNSLSNLYNNATFSINLSPQAILASYLSASLAEFLQVDSHLIETSLLTDQHVKLHQIQLKPRTVRQNSNNNNNNKTVTLTGTIQHIEFRWEWDTQTYISNVRLKIVGVDLRLSSSDSSNIDSSRSDEQGAIENEPNVPTTTAEAASGDADWKTVYMQQIVDHLSVSITDVRITIGLDDDGKELIVLGSNIDLKTQEQQMQDILGEEEDSTTSLMQLMSLQSLSAYFKEPNGEQLQLLDGFGYSASIERISGRRFVDGIMNGLVITGNPRESMQWYLGAVQVDGLLQLRQLLLVVEPDMDISLPEPSSNNDRTEEESSVFELPLPSMSIAMEENIKFHFKDGAVQYRTDGSECIVQLGRAFAELMNQEQLAMLNNLTVDAINCSVVLRQPDDDSDTINVKLPLNTQMMERFQKFYRAYSEVLQKKNDAETVTEDVDCDAFREQPWSLDIQGTSTLEISNELGWMNWSMKHVSITTTHGGKMPFDATWKSAHLASSQGIMMDVPTMELLDDAMHLRGSIDITIASMDAATHFSEFLQNAASNYSSDESSSSPPQTTELLCDIFLPKINAMVLEPNGGMRFECENLDVEGTSLSLRGRSVQISTLPNGIASNYFSCRDFHTAFKLFCAGADQTVNVKLVQMCDIQYLSSVRIQSLSAEATIDPTNINSISDMIVHVEEAVLTADFKSDNWSNQIETETEADPISLPNITVSKMNLTLHFIGSGITLENARIGLPEFKGNASTRSDALAKHYVKLVKKRLPFLLTKANVAGVNVGDSLSSAVATVAVKSSLVGTLVGVVGKDGVGAAITAGKATRGASESERYHFGDFSKGIAASAKGASLSGTAAASSSYASENRVRLSSAAGSGVGMVAGLALAGPVGLVAGSILAGKAVGNAVERRFGDPKKQELGNTVDDGTPEIPVVESEKPTGSMNLPGSTTKSQPDFQGNITSTADNTIISDSRQCLGNLTPPAVIDGRESRTANSVSISNAATSSSVSQNDPGGGYKFGNITRGLIARGKIARGANQNDGYKFGDFTRGFLG